MTRVVRLREHVHGTGFRTFGLRSDETVDLDPFLNVDLFHMDRPTFPPHPHAGFSAVTYILPESPGGFRNRDSLGDRSRIGPGAIHWTQAGRGMMHEEVPEAPGTDCWGFQIFVNLAAADKGIGPRAFHAEAADVPEVHGPGSRVRVLAGSFSGTPGALQGLALTPDLLDLHVAPGARLTVPVGERGFVFGISGEARISGASVGAGEVLLTDTELTVEAGATPWRGLFGGGRPLRQPVAWHGPFSMTTRAEALDAVERYRRGEMGRLT